MANDLNQPRGDRPQNTIYSGQRRTVGQRAVNSAIKTGKSAAKAVDKGMNKSAMRVGRQVEKIIVPFNDNIFEGLDAEEHRKALIEACVNTDSIFDCHIDDPPEKDSMDLKDYMFYNQLYFLAASQIMHPDNTGSILPGIIGGLSMIAGAALVSDDFRKNLTQHAEDKLLKYVEPFKESAPKLWQQLSAHVESHPGCASPESVALKLLRYQRQAADKVASGELSSKKADDLLCKKVAELKAAAEEVNINWDDVVRRRDRMASDLETMENERKTFYGDNWKSEVKQKMDGKCEGWSEKTGFDDNEWSTAKGWSAPIDQHSVVERLMQYQDQLADVSSKIASGEPIDGAKYEEFVGCTESECLVKMLDEVAQLKTFAEKTLGLKWDDIAKEYDTMNREEYDKYHTIKESYYPYIDPPNQHRFLENGQPNPDFAKPNAFYYKQKDKRDSMLRKQELTGEALDDIPIIPEIATVEGFDNKRLVGLIAADEKIREHNKRMYYELPVDAVSAGRCLKKYQQEAYSSVRGFHDKVHDYPSDSIDSTRAYDLANEMCKGVKVASDVLGFSWKDSIKAYRKDIYKSVMKHPSKSSIWKEMVDGDIVANIPTNVTYYKTENGVTKKEVKTLSDEDALKAWDGVIYNSDGSRVDDNVLMRVRNPYTEDEASHALYSLFMEDFKLNLQKTAIKESHGTIATDENGSPVKDENGEDKVVFKESKYQRQIDSINDEISAVAKKRENLVSAFISDKFPHDMIENIERNAMKFFKEAKAQMEAGGMRTENPEPSTDKSPILDESLAPSDDSVEYPALPNNSSPEF